MGGEIKMKDILANSFNQYNSETINNEIPVLFDFDTIISNDSTNRDENWFQLSDLTTLVINFRKTLASKNTSVINDMWYLRCESILDGICSLASTDREKLILSVLGNITKNRNFTKSFLEKIVGVDYDLLNRIYLSIKNKVDTHNIAQPKAADLKKLDLLTPIIQASDSFISDSFIQHNEIPVLFDFDTIISNDSTNRDENLFQDTSHKRKLPFQEQVERESKEIKHQCLNNNQHNKVPVLFDNTLEENSNFFNSSSDSIPPTPFSELNDNELFNSDFDISNFFDF